MTEVLAHLDAIIAEAKQQRGLPAPARRRLRPQFPQDIKCQIDISGTEGVLRITNPLAFQNKSRNAIEDMNGDAQTSHPLHIPGKYETLAKSGLDVSVQDLAYLYAAYARDKVNGTSEASNFRDAVRQHHRSMRLPRTSADFFG